MRLCPQGRPRHFHCQQRFISLSNALQVHLYNMFGTQLPRHFSMGSEVQREGILDCQLYGDGLVVLTKGLQLWALSGLAEPRPQKLASPALKEPPSCMAIFQPRHTLSGCLEVHFHHMLPITDLMPRPMSALLGLAVFCCL